MWQRCQPSASPRGTEDVTGTHCVAKYNAKNNDIGSGDRGYLWKCPRCQTLAESIFADNSKESLLSMVCALSDKFDVVNKIQLPRLNLELAHIKHVSEKVAKQNAEIIKKLTDAERMNMSDKRSSTAVPVQYFRKRNLNLTALGRWTFAGKRIRQSMLLETTEHTPMISSEKTRHRVRRTSYTHFLSRIIHLLNRKSVQSRKTSKKRRR